jgi:hypothetical protein
MDIDNNKLYIVLEELKLMINKNKNSIKILGYSFKINKSKIVEKFFIIMERFRGSLKKVI